MANNVLTIEDAREAIANKTKFLLTEEGKAYWKKSNEDGFNAEWFNERVLNTNYDAYHIITSIVSTINEEIWVRNIESDSAMVLPTYFLMPMQSPADKEKQATIERLKRIVEEIQETIKHLENGQS